MFRHIFHNVKAQMLKDELYALFAHTGIHNIPTLCAVCNESGNSVQISLSFFTQLMLRRPLRRHQMALVVVCRTPRAR